jgi:ferric-dicitrate binding protein FerR (iron transport regulator)
VPSTKRRRRERRIHRRYYPTARPRLRRAGIIALVVVLAALAGILVWAAVFYK